MDSARLKWFLHFVMAVCAGTLLVMVFGQGSRLAYSNSLNNWRSNLVAAHAFTPHSGVIRGVGEPYYDDAGNVVYDVTVQSGDAPPVQWPVPDLVNRPLVQGAAVRFWTYHGDEANNPVNSDLYISGQPWAHPWDPFVSKAGLGAGDGMAFFTALFTTWPGWALFGALAFWAAAAWGLKRYQQRREEQFAPVAPPCEPADSLPY